MATQKIEFKDIGNFVQSKINKTVEFGANDLLGKLKQSDVPIKESTMRTSWFKRQNAPDDFEVINKLPYAEPVTFGYLPNTVLPPSWKNGYKLTAGDDEFAPEVPRNWAEIKIEQTKRNMKSFISKL